MQRNRTTAPETEDQRAPSVFWEAQQDLHCGRHALNMILGHAAFTERDIDQIARQVDLDCQAASPTTSGLAGESAPDYVPRATGGNWDADVLLKAASGRKGIFVAGYAQSKMPELHAYRNSYLGSLIHEALGHGTRTECDVGHYTCLRKSGEALYHLDSLNAGSAKIKITMATAQERISGSNINCWHFFRDAPPSIDIRVSREASNPMPQTTTTTPTTTTTTTTTLHKTTTTQPDVCNVLPPQQSLPQGSTSRRGNGASAPPRTRGGNLKRKRSKTRPRPKQLADSSGGETERRLETQTTRGNGGSNGHPHPIAKKAKRNNAAGALTSRPLSQISSKRRRFHPALPLSHLPLKRPRLQNSVATHGVGGAETEKTHSGTQENPSTLSETSHPKAPICVKRKKKNRLCIKT